MKRSKLLTPIATPCLTCNLAAPKAPRFKAFWCSRIAYVKRICFIIALMFIMSAMFFSVPAYASDGDPLENLTVDAVWLEGDTLHIEVTDKQTGINQTLQMPLDEYAGNSEYVSVQAVDRNGGKSNTIQFKNPFYTPGGTDSPLPTTPADGTEGDQPSESGIPEVEKPADGLRPFTPDGTGTVIDNVTDGDGKEFFSVQTPDGNVFYLIVDRQRDTENVYLLGAVTENDLLSLAKDGDGLSQSGIPSQEPPQTTPTAVTEQPEPDPPVPPAPSGGTNNGTMLFVVIAAIAVGGAGYYFKIVRPKQNAASGADDGGYDDYDGDDDSDYDERDYGEPGEDGDEE